MYHNRVCTNLEKLYFSIKFNQRFHLNIFLSWEKTTFKVVFHTKRYSLKTTMNLLTDRKIDSAKTEFESYTRFGKFFKQFQLLV